jgi:nitrogen PTS system EIIA component
MRVSLWKESQMQSEIMTVNEVADYLRVNPQTVYRKAKSGELPSVRIGRAIRFRRDTLEDWLKGLANSRQNTPQAVREHPSQPEVLTR